MHPPPPQKKKTFTRTLQYPTSPNPDAQKGASGLRGAGLDREVTAKRVYLGPQQPSVLRMYIPKSRYGALTLKNSRISLGLRWGLDPPKTPKKPCRTLLQALKSLCRQNPRPQPLPQILSTPRDYLAHLKSLHSYYLLAVNSTFQLLGFL